MARVATAQVISTINLVLVIIAIVSAAPPNDLSSRRRTRARIRKSSEDETAIDQPRKRDVQADDQYPAESAHHHPHPHNSGGGGGGHDHSRGAKNFMYAHQPSPKTYEFGYKRGNNHHTIERYEKAGPKHNFNTKVRWSDAKGGHGEMYWDYNHAPHSHHGDGGSGGGGHGHSHGGHGHAHGSHGHSHDGHGHSHSDGGHGHPHGHYSEPVPSYLEAESKTSLTTPEEDHLYASDTRTSTKLLKRTGLEKKSKNTPKKYSKKRRSKNASKASRQKYDTIRPNDSRQPSDVIRTTDYRQPHVDVDRSRVDSPSVFPQLLGYDPYVPPTFVKDNKNKETRSKKKKNRDRNSSKSRSSEKNYGRRSKKKQFKSSPKDTSVIPKLAYDLDTGRVYDENTETWFKLVKV